jgi:hypothetical protein
LNVTQHGSAITPIEAGPKQLENANSCATNDPDTGLPDGAKGMEKLKNSKQNMQQGEKGREVSFICMKLLYWRGNATKIKCI